MDTEGVVVTTVRVDDVDDGISVRYATVPLRAVKIVGPAPKGVTRHALKFGPENRAWRCSVVVDI